MSNFRSYWPAAVVLVAFVAVAFLLPEDKVFQGFMPLATGLAMLLVNTLLGRPNLVIERLGSEVSYEWNRNSSMEVECWAPGSIVNKSPTGEGDIDVLSLTVDTDDGEIEIPAEYGVFVGVRIRKLGRHPQSTLRFVAKMEEGAVDALGGRPASIAINAVGQRRKAYKLRMASEPPRKYEGPSVRFID